MIRVYLDDERVPPTQSFDLVVRSFDEAILAFESYGCPRFISFDYDLNAVKTGYDVAIWMTEQDKKVNGHFFPTDFEFVVHSSTSIQRDEIIGYLTRYLLNRE
jgi:hypothetical protein